MKIVLQKVSEAKVSVDDIELASIKKGYMLLVGIAETDNVTEVEYLANKIAKLRVFEDENDKLNLSIKDVDGDILSISQFTLLANTKKGNRPSFINAARPEKGLELYEKFNELLKQNGLNVFTGQFGAHMAISLVNDGPVTIVFDTENL